jgi:thioredoxin-dependent peroxiredoxin
MSSERKEAFDLVGTMVTLVGPELKVGDNAPDFTLRTGKMQTVSMENYRGKPLLISVVPSIDTGVCALQTSHFDKEAESLAGTATFLTVSVDLPFAQQRWCGANNALNGEMLSDYFDLNFGSAYGTHIQEVRLESRAVFVVDAAGIIQYVQYVPKAVEEPDYDSALNVLKSLV